MCYHAQQTKTTKAIQNRFKVGFEAEEFYKPAIYNGFQFPKTPVITNENPNNIQLFDWGLIPQWAKDNSIRQYTLNARIETLGEKASFKNVLNNRCMILSDGFFEWKWRDPKGKQKQKYKITLPDNELFAFGGLWSEWVDKQTGEIVKTYSIVTTAATGLMSEIHNSKKRMPIILSPDNEQEWLSQGPVNEFKKVDVALKEVEV